MQVEAPNPLTTSDAIERDIKVGSVVTFAPKDAIGGAQGLRKSIKGRIQSIDEHAGTALVGDWLVPIGKVQRLRKYVHRDWKRQEGKAVREHVYGGLARGEKGKLRTCAADARKAFMAPVEYSGPADAGFYADLKRARDRFMREKGIEDTSDLGQCEALPLLIERAFKHGKKPALDSISYKSAETGALNVGDKIRLAGQAYELKEITSNGQAILKGPNEIRVPMDSVPVDREPEPITKEVPATVAADTTLPERERMPRQVRHRRERKILRMPGIRRAAFHYRPERTRRTVRTRHRHDRRRRRDRCKKSWVCRSTRGQFVRLPADLRPKARNPGESNYLPWIIGGELLFALWRMRRASR